jgi:hypothetical protein
VAGPDGFDSEIKMDYIDVFGTQKGMPWIPLLLLDE